MQTLLVALDGSKAAYKALEVAMDIAKQHKAMVVLLHVLLRDKEPEELLRLSGLASGSPGLSEDLSRLLHAGRAERTAEEIMADPGALFRPVPESILRKIAAFVLARGRASAAKRRVSIEVLEPADVPAATAIVTAAAAAGADVIVMGSRGLRQIEAFTFGSVSLEVCRLAHTTCIAVH